MQVPAIFGLCSNGKAVAQRLLSAALDNRADFASVSIVELYSKIMLRD